jgi:hypothetical protein
MSAYLYLRARHRYQSDCDALPVETVHVVRTVRARRRIDLRCARWSASGGSRFKSDLPSEEVSLRPCLVDRLPLRRPGMQPRATLGFGRGADPSRTVDLLPSTLRCKCDFHVLFHLGAIAAAGAALSATECQGHLRLNVRG